MKAIIIAFTLKGQSFEEIKKHLIAIKERQSPTVVIHGFMPKSEVVERGFSTEVVDTLQELFPVQLNMYNGGPMRLEMVSVAKKLGAEVFVIGEIIEGVKEEVDMYALNNITVNHIDLHDDNSMTNCYNPRKFTFGQKAVGVKFNPSGYDAVSQAKQTIADAIDQMNDFRQINLSCPGIIRHASAAITELESAQMRMVKALTWED